jgi:hypothetical protein
MTRSWQWLPDPRASVAAGGFVIWLLFVGLAPRGTQGLLMVIENLLLLAVLTHAPLALGLVAQWDAVPASPWLMRWIGRLQPVAGLGVVIAMMLPHGWLALGFAMPWLFVTGSIALYGLLRLIKPGSRTSAELSVTVGLLYLPVGALWLVAYRYGLRPLGFADVIVLLTAVHFHYTGFCVPILTGILGRFLTRHAWPRGGYDWFARGVIGATPLIALGITLSSMLELLGVSVLVVSIMGLAYLLGQVALAQSIAAARWLLMLAAGAMVFAIACALMYGVGEFFGQSWISLPRMVQWHGWTNAFGSVLAALIGWQLVGNTARPATSSIDIVALPL